MPELVERDHVRQVREFYDREAERYLGQRYGTDEPGVARPYRERMAHILELLDRKGGDALDVGCGPGVLLASLVDHDFRVTAVDLSREMAIRARAKVRGDRPQSITSFGTAVADALPFKDGSFDVVTCIGVVSYWPDLDAGFRELARVLKPNGLLVIQASNKLALWEYENRLVRIPYQEIKTRLTGRDVRDYKFKLRAYRPGHFEQHLAGAGFRVETRRFYDHRIPFLGLFAKGASNSFSEKMAARPRVPFGTRLASGFVVKAIKAP